MDINEIARRAGVSRATVSRYLNDGYVSAEKRKLISSVIEETGYVPSQQARTLRTGKTGLVGVIIPKINSASIGRMVLGITQTLTEQHYQLVLGNTDNNESLEVDYLNLFTRHNNVDGIILIATMFTPVHLEAIAKLHVPLVVLGQRLEGHSCVYQDNYQSMRDLIAPVLANSAHPAYLGVTQRDRAAGHDRCQAFLDACAEARLEVPEKALRTAHFAVDSGYEQTERLLSAYPEADALVCATDSIAFGAMACLREHGRTVPDEVQVTGVGDNEFARVMYPSLTTVHHFYKTSGTKAAVLLVDAMSGDKSVSHEVKIGYKILRRNSTRPVC